MIMSGHNERRRASGEGVHLIPDLTVIVPSRGRPANAHRLIQAWKDTGAQATLVFGVDDDDPTINQYPDGAHIDVRRGMIGTLNSLAMIWSERDNIIGFMGDDHQPRTDRWDEKIYEELADLGTGIVYCNDLFQGPNLPTAVFMTSDIIRALGHMAPPCLRHMYADNYWLDLGRAIDSISYLPNVIIEHIHPHAGKGEVDAGYDAVWPLMEPDRIAYEQYKASGQFAVDVEKVTRASTPVH